MTEATRPTPVPDPETEPYWEGVQRRELLIPRCKGCGTRWFPPSASCPACSAFDHEWVPASGRGEIVTYTVIHRAPGPAFAERTPYVLAIIQLAEGPRMLTNVVECSPSDVSIGMPVEVTFEEIAPDALVPQFRPLASPQAGKE
jgi:hypothetical protein